MMEMKYYCNSCNCEIVLVLEEISPNNRKCTKCGNTNILPIGLKE